METATLFTTRDIKALNAQAIKHKFNRSLASFTVSSLDPEGVHVLQYSFLHNDDHLRLSILFKMVFSEEPVQAFIDATFDDLRRYSHNFTTEQLDQLIDRKKDDNND